MVEQDSVAEDRWLSSPSADGLVASYSFSSANVKPDGQLGKVHHAVSFCTSTLCLSAFLQRGVEGELENSFGADCNGLNQLCKGGWGWCCGICTSALLLVQSVT